MLIEIGSNLGFTLIVVSFAWALAYAFKAFHQSS